MKRITVLLAEDHAVVREALHALLNLDASIEVIGEARNGREAAELALRLRPMVVVMDIAMPGLNGFEASRQILAAAPDTRILILSAYGDDAYVDGAIALGARGYMIKHSSAEHLLTAIQDIARGLFYFSPEIGRRKLKRGRKTLDRKGQQQTVSSGLTARERQTLQLIAEGRANKEIAAELGISIKTVEKHRHNLMAKLDIHDTAGLTRYAISAGIIECGPLIARAL